MGGRLGLGVWRWVEVDGGEDEVGYAGGWVGGEEGKEGDGLIEVVVCLLVEDYSVVRGLGEEGW